MNNPHTKLKVSSDAFKANSERRRIEARAFRYLTAEMARGAPAKVIAAETGITVSEIYEYRKALRNPNLDAWSALQKRRPDLKPQIDRIMSGEATSEQINDLIRWVQQGERYRT